MRRLADRLRDERGDVTITQALIAASLLVVVLGGTLGLFEQFTRTSADLVLRHDAQDRAREASDRIARDLRNLASPEPDQPLAIDQAGPYDLVFKTVDPSATNLGLNATGTKRVRFCLDTSNPKNAILRMQQQTWTTATPPAMPSTAACPAAGWGSSAVVADRISNRYLGQSRPIFTYDSASLTAITTIHTDLWVDADVTREPPETKLSSGVFLRNQNRAPVASFTAVPSAQGIVLNGSASYDPEGEELEYVWYDGATKVGTGITFTYVVPAGSVRTLQLKVFDPAALEGASATQVVTA